MTDQSQSAMQSPLPAAGQKNLEAFQALLEIDEKEHSFKRRKGYLTAYLLSVLLPPLGVYFCARYVLFSNRSPEDIRAGIISLGLTIGSLFICMWYINVFFSVPALKNTDNGIDSLKQLITPENMRQLQDLAR